MSIIAESVKGDAITTKSFCSMDFGVAFIAAAVSLIVYLLTLAPTVSGEDSGELITAAYTMGIAHPPGYPTWCLLGKLFTLIPIGTVAWRVNLMSSVFASASVGLCCLIGIHLLRNHATLENWNRTRVAAFAGALAFGFSREFWEQSVIAEVYSLNAFFIALCVLLLLRWQATRNDKLLWAFAFVWGLSLGNHNTMVVLAPVFGLFILYVDRMPWKRWRVYVVALIVAVLPLTVYLYLPIRSAANPPMDWGNPETWEAFWDVVTRKQYTFMFTENPRSIGLFLKQCWTFLSLYMQEFSPWLAWAPAAGMYFLWRCGRSGALLLAGVALSVLFSVIVINNFSIEKEAIWINNVFWIPVYMICGLGIAGLTCGISELGRTPRVKLLMGVACASVVVASPLAWNYWRNDKSEYYLARDYATNLFKTLDENAIFFPTADHATFPCIYLQSVEGMRPDVLIANKYGYPDEAVYAEMPEEQRKAFARVPNARDERVIEEWAVGHYRDRPIYFSTKRAIRGARLVSAGLLYRALREGETLPERDYFAEYQWHTLDETDARRELTAEMILADVHFANARTQFEKGETVAALESVAAAMRIEGMNKESLNNAGSLCAENSQLEAAEKYYAAAMEIDPEYETTMRNLGKLRLQAGDFKAALPYFEKLLGKDPLDPESNWLAYECLKGQLRFEEAFAQLKRMATFPYEDGRVYREMGMHYLNNEQRPEIARQMFARSLQIDSSQEDLRQLVSQLDGPGNAGHPSPIVPGGEFDPTALVPKPPIPAIPAVPAPPAAVPD